MIDLPNDVKLILNKLNDEGYEAFAVGGAVRDMLSDAIPHDYDAATNARPEDVKRIFGGNVFINTGIKHGTVTVVVGENPVEITTYRSESVYSDGRHPDSVIFSDRLEDDVRRRDFTVNALAYSEKTGVIDLCGGIPDLQNRLIRCVGDPYERFSEDRLRIMRALRFSSVLGFDIEEQTSQAIHALCPKLNTISAERVYAELKPLICGKNAGRVINGYPDVMSVIFPGAELPSPDEIDRIKNKFTLRLAGLLWRCDTDTANKILQGLKASTKDTAFVCGVIENKAARIDKRSDVIKIIRKIGYENAEALLYLKSVFENRAFENTAEEIKNSGEAVFVSELKINGSDIAKFGISGREVGRTLDELLDMVVVGAIKNEKGPLEEYVKRKFGL